MNRRMLGLILAFVVVASALSMSLVAQFFNFGKTQTQIYLDSNDFFEIRNFKFDKGIDIEGLILISSQANKDVNVWITDENGQTILNLDRVSQNTTFNFITSESGIYTFRFNNDFDLSNSKSVTLSFIAKVGILGLYASLATWIALFSSVLLAFVVVLMWHTHKGQSSIPSNDDAKTIDGSESRALALE